MCEVWKPYKNKELYCAKCGWSRYKNNSASKTIQWAIDYPKVSLMYRLVNILEKLLTKGYFASSKVINMDTGNYHMTSTINLKSNTTLRGREQNRTTLIKH